MAPFLLAVTLSQAHRLAAGTASSHELHKFQVAAFGDSETQLPRCRLWVPSGSESRASQRPSLGSIVANRAKHVSRLQTARNALWRSNVNYSHFLIPVRFVLPFVAPLKGESK